MLTGMPKGQMIEFMGPEAGKFSPSCRRLLQGKAKDNSAADQLAK